MSSEAPSPPQAKTPVWIATDPVTIKLREQAQKVATTRSTVLIRGESGTGKDLLAALIHYLGAGHRAQEQGGGSEIEDPLLTVDCSNLPTELMESELFGYEPGAFTGASQMKRGRLELAADGTVVFDEVTALTPTMQAKLLRVLDEKKFYRLGSRAADPISLRARVIALTNIDLAVAVKQGRFRDDLYHRLNVIPMEIPPLRERRSDIPSLAEHLLEQLRGRRELSIHRSVLETLQAYPFPGNVRELRNLLERALLVSEGKTIMPEHVPQFVRNVASAVPKSLEELEREHIAHVLDHCRGRKSQAAAILGITRKTLLEKRKKYGME